jgi:hypothetical protein
MLSMDQWIDIASKFGVPVTLLGLLAYFFSRRVWPFLTKMVEDSLARGKVQEETFMAALNKRDALMADMNDRQIKAFDAMSSELRNLTNEVRRNNHK